MKKNIILTLSLIFIACTPQVTESPTATLAPPTQTPIPTPTLHSEFVELQNLISDSNENLNLLPNGQIEENGVVIPNLQVDPNGEISILVEDENIVINLADITFDDGFDIKGYELDENGEWVVEISEAELLLRRDMEKWGLAEETHEIVYDVNGSIALRNKETGEVVYWGERWSLKVMREIIYVSGDCDVTEWKGTKIGSHTFLSRDYVQPLVDYYNLMKEIKRDLNHGIFFENQYLGNNCWGLVFKFSYTSADESEKGLLIWNDTNGRPIYVKVFGQDGVEVEIVE